MKLRQKIRRHGLDLDPLSILEKLFQPIGYQAGLDIYLKIRVHTQGYTFFILLLQDKTQIVFNVIQQDNTGTDLSRTITSRTFFIRHDAHLRSYPLARDLYKAKFAWREYRMACLILLHTFLEVRIKILPICCLVHIDKVHNDYTAHITQTQLSGNFPCCFLVDQECIILLVFLACDTVAAIHVDDMQSLGMLNDQIGSTL